MADLRPVYVAGDGDVKGPASSSDNRLPLFSGATGKLLKDSGTTVTAQGRALLDDATPAEQRTTLQLANSAIMEVIRTYGEYQTGRILVTGACGIATTLATRLDSGTLNLDFHQVGGNWRIDGTQAQTNAPASAGLYPLVQVVPGTDICAQQIFRHDIARTWFRGGINGNWQGWREPVTGRPTGWIPLLAFASNWSPTYNLGVNRQGCDCQLIANYTCTSGIANNQAIAVIGQGVQNPQTTINFVAELLGTNGVNQAVSMSVRSDGLLVYNYALGQAAGPGGPGFPTYPIGFNLNVCWRTADGGPSND